MSAIASQITGVSIVCSTVYSGADQRQHQRPASLAFVRGIHRWPMDSHHKGPVTRKMFPFDDDNMKHISKSRQYPFWDKSAVRAAFVRVGKIYIIRQSAYEEMKVGFHGDKYLNAFRFTNPNFQIVNNRSIFSSNETHSDYELSLQEDTI